MPPRHHVKLTDPMVEHAVGLTRDGHLAETVAEALGVHRTTYWRWLTEGCRLAEVEGPSTEIQKRLVRLAVGVQLAMAEHERAAVANIKRAGSELQESVRETIVEGPEGLVTRTTVIETRPPDWRAQAWLLERRFPQRWGRRGAAEIPEDGTTASGATTEDVLAKIRRLRQQRNSAAAS